MSKLLILAAASVGLAVSVSFGAEKDPAYGHSAHGEAFNEGPRQEAVLIKGTGNVDFEVTTESGEASKFFNQGVGQLHGFWDFEAERSFRQVAALDPKCAMAYWGMAMANHKNVTRAKGFIAEAVKRTEDVTRREQMWIDSLANYYAEAEEGKKIVPKVRKRELVRDLEGIVAVFPEDLDAKAFLLLQIWRNAKEYPIGSHLAADLLAKQILEANPNHPVHHYRIHLWDKEKPARALDAAANCGPASPGIAHMWHMPGHIYSKLKRYGDAAWQQEASARIDHAHMMRYRITPDEIHNFAHNNEWLIRNLNHIGRAEDAIDLACNMIELPRLAKLKKGTEEYAHRGGSWSYGRIRLRDTLIRYELWDRLIAFGKSEYLEVGKDAVDEVEWNRFMGIANFEAGHPEEGVVRLSYLEEALAEERAKQEKAVAAAGKKAKAAKKSEADIRKAQEAAKRGFVKKIAARQNARDEVKAYDLILGTEKDFEAGLKLLAKLKAMNKSRKARLTLKAGDTEAAVKLAEEAVKAGPGEVVPMAAQAWILWEAEKTQLARAVFRKLRRVAAQADAELSVFDRLTPIAKSFSVEGDWRQEAKVAKDLGERPELDSLGPFRWEPPEAPGWTLKNADEEAVSLADYRGRPVLVIFYLGKGCTHCMEQLNAFAPMVEKYTKAGIDIVAVSTDTIEGLEFTYQISTDDKKNPFPFPLLSDAGLGAFREYRAYDDFEEMALHGTFLIDRKGRVRWQDIGFEPFMHAEFLLGECERLLGFDESRAGLAQSRRGAEVD